MSVATKIFLGFTVVIVSFGLVSVDSIFRMRSLGENLRFLREGVIPTRDKLKDLHSELKAFEVALSRRRLSDLEWLQSFLPTLEPFERIAEMVSRIDALADRAHVKPANRRMLAEVGQRLEVLVSGRLALDGLLEARGLPRVQKLITELPPEATDPDLFALLARELDQCVRDDDLATAREIQRALRGIFRHVERKILEVAHRYTLAIEATTQQAERDEDNAILAVIISSTVALFISLAALFVSYLTLAPIRQLRGGVRRISEGDYERRVRVSTRDEIGQLAAEFNKMAQSLAERDHILEQQREALLRADRLATIGKMSSQVTHEIRNPLSSIGLNVELLEDELERAATGDADAAAEARALLGAVTAEVDRLRAVTEQYLRFARLPKMTRTTASLSRVLTELLNFMREELAGLGIRLETEILSSAELELDVQQIRQAFLNILRNAAEAMSDGGVITVSFRRQGNQALVVVRDTGEGIAESDLKAVFDPFYSSKQNGTGLGLTLTHQIITDHNGTIEIESERGQGTQVTVALPITTPGASNEE